MSAFIPNRKDPEVTERALSKVAADKKREAGDGFDGTWVAHPDLIATARAEFDAVLGGKPNQLQRLRPEVSVSAKDLIDIASAGGEISTQGVRSNISVAVRYIDSWLRGIGAAALDNLMEDAATAEISRSQIWQWIYQGSKTKEGNLISREWVQYQLDDVVANLERFPSDRIDDAVKVFREVCLEEEFPTFLTIPAYAQYLFESPKVAA
jgi:malate synthase